MLDWPNLPDAPWRLAVALGIGLLLGAERERRKADAGPRPAAGVRTFALVALLGGLAAVLGGTPLLLLAGGFVAAATLLSYALGDRTDPGLTSEVALVIAFVLGALAQREPALAGGVSVVVTVLLSARTWLHHFVRQVLTEAEMHDLLVFAAAALVVLPLLPDRDLGPYGVFNPFTIWRLVVIVMAIGGLGHVAVRMVGPRYGLPVAGLLSGFVSSAATVSAMGTRASAQPDLREPAVAGAVLSSVATIVQMAIVVGAVSHVVLRDLALPLLFAGIVVTGYGLVFSLRLRRAPATAQLDPGPAFDLRNAVLFAATVSGVLLLSAALADRLGEAGLLLSTAVAGFADAHAAAIAAASLAVVGKVGAAATTAPILAGLTANALTKAVVSFVTGGRRFGMQVSAGQVLTVIAAWAGLIVAVQARGDGVG